MGVGSLIVLETWTYLARLAVLISALKCIEMTKHSHFELYFAQIVRLGALWDCVLQAAAIILTMGLIDTVQYPYVSVTAAALVVYLVSGAVYRLYFSPVAKFPGPRLAALTLWHEVPQQDLRIDS